MKKLNLISRSYKFFWRVNPFERIVFYYKGVLKTTFYGGGISLIMGSALLLVSPLLTLRYLLIYLFSPLYYALFKGKKLKSFIEMKTKREAMGFN